jgi:hypothetical protein
MGVCKGFQSGIYVWSLFVSQVLVEFWGDLLSSDHIRFLSLSVPSGSSLTISSSPRMVGGGLASFLTATPGTLNSLLMAARTDSQCVTGHQHSTPLDKNDPHCQSTSCLSNLILSRQSISKIPPPLSTCCLTGFLAARSETGSPIYLSRPNSVLSLAELQHPPLTSSFAGQARSQTVNSGEFRS